MRSPSGSSGQLITIAVVGRQRGVGPHRVGRRLRDRQPEIVDAVGAEAGLHRGGRRRDLAGQREVLGAGRHLQLDARPSRSGLPDRRDRRAVDRVVEVDDLDRRVTSKTFRTWGSGRASASSPPWARTRSQRRRAAPPDRWSRGSRRPPRSTTTRGGRRPRRGPAPGAAPGPTPRRARRRRTRTATPSDDQTSRSITAPPLRPADPVAGPTRVAPPRPPPGAGMTRVSFVVGPP